MNFSAKTVLGSLVLGAVIAFPFLVSDEDTQAKLQDFTTPQEFRDLTVQYVRDVAEAYFDEETAEAPLGLVEKGEWEVTVAVYQNGEMKGESTTEDDVLNEALERATENALSEGGDYTKLAEEELDDAQFLVTFTYDRIKEYSFIEHEGNGEIVEEDQTMIYQLNRDLIEENLDLGFEYILKTIDPELGGVHKYYYALDDTVEDRLHTIYTASTVFTLLKMYDHYDEDPEIWDQILKSTDFILSMQNLDKDSRVYGAFHYSYYPSTDTKEEKYVVGTTSKTIYTLIELYKRTQDEKYLDAAQLGADWLLTMQADDGTIKSYLRYEDGSWFGSSDQSYLYNGQVLSALSRMYVVTEDSGYLEGAEAIASRFLNTVETEGCYVGDDYREANPISSSWLILSLYDYYKASGDLNTKETVFTCTNELLGRQFLDEDDALRHGRWEGSFSSSGAGWINEVLSEIYVFCVEEGRDDCEPYVDAMEKVTRWTIQSTYSDANMYMIPNKDRARGGIFWNYDNKYVRTDAVCHGLNAYVNMLDVYEDGVLVELEEPEFPLIEYLL